MPYDKMKNVDVVDFVCHARQRLEKPPSCPEKIYKVMLQTWMHVSFEYYSTECHGGKYADYCFISFVIHSFVFGSL